ncbi:MAG: hypothetical protein HXX08_11030 [Chloroflexi bacterium]|uniref:Uncharacterized protein n=1 Tax=Candidatus Chlorohelix allophototropha TaxID=3003348 RepID=A0A8T7M2R3_9CHLR|nr:hypothetical protein [Chloroflexota bacterium]WJW65771.1 hypothetical protein OZ401_001549 [Chloroflexota bacterium L227-S17]
MGFFSGNRRKARLFAAFSLSIALLITTNMVALAKDDDSLSASASYMRVYKGATTAIKAAGTPLIYQGGQILTASKVYISWWGTQWNTGFTTGGYTSATAQTYIRGFFGNVGGSSWNNVDNQYCMGITKGSTSCGSSGTHITNPAGQLKGEWVDTTSVPSRPTQANIASAALRSMAHFGGYDPQAIYFVFTPSGRNMSGFGTQWCAWHDVTTSGSNQVAYAYMPYVPSVGSTCGANFVNKTNDSFGHGYFDGFSIVGGHEFVEAVSDPHPSGTNAGWWDSSGAENGDKCAWSASSANISLGGNNYAVQPIWSNAIGGCATSA